MARDVSGGLKGQEKRIAKFLARNPPPLASKRGTPQYQIEDVPPGQPNKLGFYSKAAQVVADPKTQATQSGAQWQAFLKARGVKPEQMKWSGLDDLLTSRASGKVTRQEVLDHLDQNDVQVEQVTLEGSRETSLDDSAIAADRKLIEKAGYRPVVTNEDGQPILRYEPVIPTEDNYIALDVDELPVDVDHEAHRAAVRIEQYWRQPNPNQVKFGPSTHPTMSLPGGENYREVLLKLPTPKRKTYEDLKGEGYTTSLARNKDGSHDYKIYDGKGQSVSGGTYGPNVAVPDSEELIRRYASELQTPGKFTQGHYPEPDVLAHMRLDDRTSADGKRVLFAEEMQSDWAQKGRREGFSGNRQQEVTKVTERLRKLRTEQGNANVDIREMAEIGDFRPGSTTGHREKFEAIKVRKLELDQEIQDLNEKLEKLSRTSGQPEAPFVTQTDAWTELVLKRLLRMAAEEGYDQVAWTTGEQQAERYDLSKHVDELLYNSKTGGLVGNKGGNRVIEQSGVTPEKLSNFVGKDAADKLLADTSLVEPVKGASPYPDANLIANSAHRISGLDLKVGGEGMKAYYDRIVPKAAERVAKKWGAKVGTTKIDTATTEMRGRSGGEKFRYEMSTSWKPTGRPGFVGDEGTEYWILDTQTGEKLGPYSNADARQKEFNRLEFGDTTPSVHSIDITPEMRAGVMREGLPQYSVQPNALGLYSKLEQALTKAPQSMSASEMQKYLRDPKRGVTNSEMKWSGIAAYLRERQGSVAAPTERGGMVRQTVSPEKLLQFIRDNPILELKETAEGTRFAQFQLPGGRRYREVTLSVPNFKGGFTGGHYPTPGTVVHYRLNDRLLDNGEDVLFIEENQNDWGQKGRKQGFAQEKPKTVDSARITAAQGRLDASKAAFNQYDAEMKAKYSAIQKTSFPPSYNTFLQQAQAANLSNPEGRALYAVSRMQNAGFSIYRDPGRAIEVMKNAKPETAQKWLDHWNSGGSIKKLGAKRNTDRQRVLSLQERMTASENEHYRGLATDVSLRDNELGMLRYEASGGKTPGIPEGPFVMDTDEWTGLALKRLLRMAAEKDYDYLAWTPGKVQVDRWQGALRKAVDKIYWEKTEKGIQLKGYKISSSSFVRDDTHPAGISRTPVPIVHERLVVDTTEREDALSDAIGKAMSDQIIKNPEQSGTIEGDNLKIDDTGMAGFYDRIMLQNMEHIGKEWGAKVESLHIPVGGSLEESFDPGPGMPLAPGQSQGGYMSVHALRITPEMRESIMNKGFPQLKAEAPGAAEAVTLEGVRSHLPEALQSKLEQDGDNFVIKTPRGEIRIEPTGEIQLDWYALEAGYGEEGVAGVRAGAKRVTGMTVPIDAGFLVQLVKKGVLPHEVGHLIMDHFSTPKEYKLIEAKLGDAARKEGISVGEKFADGWDDWFKSDREMREGESLIHRIYRRIYEFFQGIYEAFKPSLEGIYRRAARGKTFERKPAAARASEAEPATAQAGVESRAVSPTERAANFPGDIRYGQESRAISPIERDAIGKSPQYKIEDQPFNAPRLVTPKQHEYPKKTDLDSTEEWQVQSPYPPPEVNYPPALNLGVAERIADTEMQQAVNRSVSKAELGKEAPPPTAGRYRISLKSMSDAEIMKETIKYFGTKLGGADLAHIAGVPEGSRVFVKAFPTRSHIEVYGDIWDKNPKKGKVGEMIRVFHPSNPDGSGPYIENYVFNLNKTGTGLGSKVFADEVERAAAAGFKFIRTYAGKGDVDEEDPRHKSEYNGFYTWARLGYDGKVRGPKGDVMVSELMKTKEGRDWWLENGHAFEARFDLREGSLSRRVLAEYIKARAAKEAERAREEPGAGGPEPGGRRPVGPGMGSDSGRGSEVEGQEGP